MEERNAPAFTVHYEVRAGDEKSIWPKCGAAWKIQDGRGLKVKLEALPITGELFLFEPRDNEEGEG